MLDFQRVSGEIEKIEPVSFDEPDGLNSEKKIIDISKSIGLFVIGAAYDKYKESLRDEQELIGMISNIVIEIYALESALLRSQKMLKSKKPERAAIPIKMTKVLFHNSLEKINFLAMKALEAIEKAELLKKDLETIRNLTFSPPLNTVALRRNIADAMIRYGRYSF
jgi:hypothetical protein